MRIEEIIQYQRKIYECNKASCKMRGDSKSEEENEAAVMEKPLPNGLRRSLVPNPNPGQSLEGVQLPHVLSLGPDIRHVWY